MRSNVSVGRLTAFSSLRPSTHLVDCVFGIITMANLAQNSILPNPFPRYQDIGTLTWEQCFALSRDGILNDFVNPLSNVPEHTSPVRKLAYLLSVMMKQPS